MKKTIHSFSMGAPAVAGVVVVTRFHHGKGLPPYMRAAHRSTPLTINACSFLVSSASLAAAHAFVSMVQSFGPSGQATKGKCLDVD